MSSKTKAVEAVIEPAFLHQANWSGAPVRLKPPGQEPNQITMNQTTNGPMVLTGYNLDRNLGTGTMVYRKGNNTPSAIEIDGSFLAPVFTQFDFNGDSLTVQNESVTNSTNIQVSSYGFGRLVDTRVNLNVNTPLRPGSAAQGTLPSDFYTLQLDSDLEYSIFGVLTPGSSKFKVYAIGAIDPDAVPSNYTEVTSDKSLRIRFSTNGGAIYIVNLSPFVAPSGSFLIF